MDWCVGGREFAGGVSDAKGVVLRAPAVVTALVVRAARQASPREGGSKLPHSQMGCAQRNFSWVSSCSAWADGFFGRLMASLGGVPSGAARRYWTGQLTGKPRSRATANGQYG